MIDDDRNKTRLHDSPVQTPAASPTATQPLRSPSTPAPALAAPAMPLGQFSPPAHRRQRGLASRSWVPVALSFGTALIDVVALVIYFAHHT